MSASFPEQWVDQMCSGRDEIASDSGWTLSFINIVIQNRSVNITVFIIAIW
jgi:hypothetical protein